MEVHMSKVDGKAPLNETLDSYEHTYSYEFDGEFEPIPVGTETILIAMFIIGSIISAAVNIVVISFMIYGKKRKRSLNSLVLNLAISDWTLGLVCLPFLFSSTFMNGWAFGEVLCKFIPFVFKVSQIVSIVTMTAIGIERYHVVMYPLHIKASSKQIAALIALTWLVSFGIASPKFAIHTFVSIVVLFTLCWLPLNLYNVVLISYNSNYLRTHPQTTKIIRASLFIWVVMADTVINPIVYVFLSNKFRSDICTSRFFNTMTNIFTKTRSTPTLRNPGHGSPTPHRVVIV
ncbi:neuropeptide Y receptor type 5-like [Glandiceps talaboti]